MIRHWIARKFAKYLTVDELRNHLLFYHGWTTLDITASHDGETYVWKAVGTKEPLK